MISRSQKPITKDSGQAHKPLHPNHAITTCGVAEGFIGVLYNSLMATPTRDLNPVAPRAGEKVYLGPYYISS